MSKTMWMEAAGWHNADVTAQIEAAVRPILIEAFGKVVGAEVRYSVNKRAAAITVGVAQTEVDRVKKAHADNVKKSADNAAPAAAAQMTNMAAELAQLKALLAGLLPQGAPVAEVPAAKPGRGRKARVA